MPRVLDLLDAAGARASFFCIGARARACPALVREIARRGHLIENHTLHHPRHFAALPPSALRREIDATQDILASLTGRCPQWFRAPMGLRSPLLQATLQRSGLHLASWTRRAGGGGVSGNATAGLRRLARNLAAGDVLLMHDGRCARDAAHRPVVLSTLPALLHAMQRLSLAGVHLPRLDPQRRTA